MEKGSWGSLLFSAPIWLQDRAQGPFQSPLSGEGKTHSAQRMNSCSGAGVGLNYPKWGLGPVVERAQEGTPTLEAK